jgi:hypothetical protein
MLLFLLSYFFELSQIELDIGRMGIYMMGVLSPRTTRLAGLGG